MAEDTKYVCFKIDDWLDEWERLGALIPDAPEGEDSEEHPLSRLQTKRLHDSVVIRLQDVFAPPGLDAYANSIAVAIEMLNGAGIDKELADRLRKVADYFHERAAESWEMDRKLPD